VLANIYPTAQHADELKPYVEADELLAAAIELFARIPGLPQQLLERAEREEAADEVAPFFNYLFEGASSPAVGAHYDVVCCRLRDTDERNLASGAVNGDLANFNGHEITIQMIEAGAEIIAEHREDWTADSLAREVYLVMCNGGSRTASVPKGLNTVTFLAVSLAFIYESK
jgi:hypothetical protein